MPYQKSIDGNTTEDWRKKWAAERKRERKVLGATKAERKEAKAEIARLLGDPVLFDRCFGFDDPKVLMEHGIANIVRISKDGKRLELAFHASKWLVEYGQALLTVKGGKAGGKQDQLEVIAELRTLYAKALPKQEAPFLEVSAEEPKKD